MFTNINLEILHIMSRKAVKSQIPTEFCFVDGKAARDLLIWEYAAGRKDGSAQTDKDERRPFKHFKNVTDESQF